MRPELEEPFHTIQSTLIATIWKSRNNYVHHKVKTAYTAKTLIRDLVKSINDHLPKRMAQLKIQNNLAEFNRCWLDTGIARLHKGTPKLALFQRQQSDADLQTSESRRKFHGNLGEQPEMVEAAWRGPVRPSFLRSTRSIVAAHAQCHVDDLSPTSEQ